MYLRKKTSILWVFLPIRRVLFNIDGFLSHSLSRFRSRNIDPAPALVAFVISFFPPCRHYRCFPYPAIPDERRWVDLAGGEGHQFSVQRGGNAGRHSAVHTGQQDGLAPGPGYHHRHPTGGSGQLLCPGAFFPGPEGIQAFCRYGSTLYWISGNKKGSLERRGGGC